MTGGRTLAAGMLGFVLAAGQAHALPLASGWLTNPSNGRSYAMFVNGPPVASEMAAVKLGGHLVTLRNQAEQDFVFEHFGNYNGQQRLLWTGLTDSVAEGQFRWMSGEPVTYTNWAPGEPNDSQDGEDFAALYYPNHSQAGKWNDWTSRLTDPIGLPFNAVVERGPQDHVPAFLLYTDPSWRALAPAGNTEGQSLTSVGTVWQLTHLGWNTSTTFDDSGWSPATPVGDEVWSSGQDTPTYFRKTFDLSAVPSSMTLLASIDDDMQLFVNGQLVLNDVNGHADGFAPLEIASYLHTGTNLIAVKAQDGGGLQALAVMLYSDSVPEPTTLLTASPAVALAARRRRR